MKHGNNFIEDLTQCLNEMMPSTVREVQKDIEKNIRAALQAAFSKLDLVTREEFDAQAGVLAKTRHKLEALEKHIQKLEKSHLSSSSVKGHKKPRDKDK